MLRSPVLLRLPFGGSCDSSGNLVIKNIRPSTSFFAVFTAAIRISGGGQPLSVLDLTGAPMASAAGTQVTLGPIYTAPEEILTLTVSGAASKALVIGSLYGFFALEPEELPTAPPGLGGSVTLQAPVSVPLTASGAQTQQPNDTQVTVQIPPGALQAILTVTAGGAAGGTVTVTGAQSGTVYLTLAASSNSVTGVANIAADTSLVVNNHTGIGGTAGDSWTLQFLPTFTPQFTSPRTPFAASAGGVASVNAAALISLIPVRSGVAGGAVTTIPVTAGKTLRLTALIVDFTNAAGVAIVNCYFALRTNPTGAVLVTSPIIAAIRVASDAAAANATGSAIIPFVDGAVEISGSGQIGISHLSSVTTGVVDVALVGYEY